MNTQIFGKRVYDNGNGGYMTEYELWFINKFGIEPYKSYGHVKKINAVDEIVLLRDEYKEMHGDICELYKVITEKEWEAWKQRKNSEVGK